MTSFGYVGGDGALAVVMAAATECICLRRRQRRWPDRDAIVDIARPLWCVDVSGATGVLIGSLQAQRLMAVGRLLVSADAIGAVSITLARLTAYLKERVAFGAPIASFQAMQHRLVELLVLEVKSRAVVLKAARGIGPKRKAPALFDPPLPTRSLLRRRLQPWTSACSCPAVSDSPGSIRCITNCAGPQRMPSSDGTARSSRALFAEVSGW